MADRPILFSAPMVRALLAGTKTQTRRVVKARADRDMGPRCVLQPHELAGEVNGGDYRNAYCAPGDQLWVREAWTTHACFDHIRAGALTTISLHYQADGRIKTGRNRAAMHMPRWASRITLEVTGVRVERLQSIGEADAAAEGFELGAPPCIDAPIRWYRHLWDQINGAGAWAANPWVWAVSFRVVKP